MKRTAARGYGGKHQAMRRKYQAQIDRDGGAYCVRCGGWITASQPWDLGHVDSDRTQWGGPEHPRCNRGAAGRLAGARRRRRAQGMASTVEPSRAW